MPTKAKFIAELLEAIRSCRGQLAILHGCKPHMVATRNAMQQLTEIRPLNMEELKAAKIDGFSETKARKFGPSFIECIQRKVQALPTIQQALQHFPVMKDKITFFQITTWTLFKEGHSVAEIAKFRHQSELQTYQHLAEGIKHGLNFVWSDLERVGLSRGLYEEIKLKLPRVLNNVDLKMVKKNCSACITLGQIALVLAYVHVRRHLDEKQLLYSEGEKEEVNLLQSNVVKAEHSESIDGEDEDSDGNSLINEQEFLGFSGSMWTSGVVHAISSSDDE